MRIARRIAALDFSARWQSGRRDEIGALGESLNLLSDNLSGAMAELERANAALAAATGQIPYVLCYPEGKYSHLTMDVAKDYYTFALRMDGWTYQTGMDPYQVPRSFVSRRITLPDYLWFLAPSGKAS